MSVVFRIEGLHYYLSNPSNISAGRSPSSKQETSTKIWNEIDRRNEQILNSKYSPIPYHHSNKSFYLNSYRSYRQLRQSSQWTDDQNYLNQSIYLNNYINQQSGVQSTGNDPTFLFGNSIIKSNKADILHIFDQQFLAGEKGTSYTDENGVIIDENGPFWPETYRILHPTPKLLTREVTAKEFYLSPSISSK